MSWERLIIIFITIFLPTLACKTKPGILREIRPVDRLDTQIEEEKCVVVMGEFYKIAVEYIDMSYWTNLMKNDIFSSKGEGISNMRKPKLMFFHIVFSNTGIGILEVEGIKLRYGEIEMKDLSIEDVQKRCKSPVFKVLDLDKLFSNRRYLNQSNSLKEIDYIKDVIDYKFEFILPQDRILKVVAFDWIPVEYRQFKLIIRLKSFNIEKEIDFDFKRHEYRRKGNHFREPLKDEEEESIYED
ncbi:MAG: hypothetical protein SVZ03_08165 [Spirochaetota bacterium]|nr:hypothetical protein [Spirochaetota bacterium]